MPLLAQFIKFGLVGFVGLIVDFSLTFIIKEKLKLNKYLANSTGFITAASVNYLLNRWWTFHSTNQDIAVEYGHFMLVSIIGLLINNFCLFLLQKRMNFYLAKLLAIVITTFWNFFANYFFTF